MNIHNVFLIVYSIIWLLLFIIVLILAYGYNYTWVAPIGFGATFMFIAGLLLVGINVIMY